MKRNAATYVVVVDGGYPNIQDMTSFIADAVKSKLENHGYLSNGEAVKVSPVRRANSKRKTPFAVETVVAGEN